MHLVAKVHHTTNDGLTECLLDEVRIFSFDPNTDNPVAALSVNYIPEPATATLAMLSMGVLLRRSRVA